MNLAKCDRANTSTGSCTMITNLKWLLVSLFLLQLLQYFLSQFQIYFENHVSSLLVQYYIRMCNIIIYKSIKACALHASELGPYINTCASTTS